MKTPNILEPIAGCTELISRWGHPEQAVAYSGLGRTFLYGLIRAGEIESVRISKNNKARGRAHRLIDLRSIDRWIEKHAKQNGGEQTAPAEKPTSNGGEQPAPHPQQYYAELEWKKKQQERKKIDPSLGTL